MSKDSRLSGPDSLTIAVVVLLIVGLFVALVSVPIPVHAGLCDQVGGVITGDWTISNTQVCSGILYTVDGSVTINAGGSLTLIDGGLRFSKDTSHTGYALTVNGGAELVLNNAVVTTQTEAIAPYLKLTLTVASGGQLTMTNGAQLKFPGTFAATGATIELTDSTITGFSSPELQGLGIYQDDNDDAPLIDWASTSVTLYRSRIERLYENASAASNPNATGPISGNIVVRSSSNLYAYDSHLGVDFSNVWGLHNELEVDATSNAYLYGVTIDRTQDPVSMSNWQPAFRPAAGGNVYLMRWLHVTTVDSTAFPVSGATITSTLSPSLTQAQYPDNAFATVPSPRTLAYLGRDVGGPNAWDFTDATGSAVIPLYTDHITTASLPNAESFGNYRVDVTFGTSSATSGVGFNAYPALAWDDSNKFLTVPFTGLTVRTGPDLAVRASDYPPMTAVQGQPFQIEVSIYNQGQTPATGFSLAAYLNGDLGTELARVDSLSIDTFLNQSLDIAGIGVLGTQSMMLVVDPDNAIDEGGAAQEANNFANVTVTVSPPPNGYVAILSPNTGQEVEPGTTLSVTGYVRDENATGLVGVPLAIELRSNAGTVVATATATTEVFGFFLGPLTVPEDVPDGTYQVVVSPSAGPISSDSRTVEVRRTVSVLNTEILGLQVWLWLIILIGAAAAIGGGTAYVKFVGLGKLVECGECGAFIAENSKRCPKCDVEFEKDAAKCSNCGTWVPVAMKQCPECGVEFATGEVEMADYEAQVRAQYESVKRRFRQEAEREIGRTLTDREFAEWWRAQPTFVTFEDWLKEEEDMRRAGSRPCPACKTLNSVTATVCHKCGSVIEPRPRSRSRAEPRKDTAAEPPTRPVPPKKPPEAPVVQKKVVRAPDAKDDSIKDVSQATGEDSIDEI